VTIYQIGYYEEQTIAPSSSFSNCCGATYVKKPTEKTNYTASHKGIRVFDGLKHEPYVGPVMQLDHIKTRNGDITVSIHRGKSDWKGAYGVVLVYESFRFPHKIESFLNNLI